MNGPGVGENGRNTPHFQRHGMKSVNYGDVTELAGLLAGSGGTLRVKAEIRKSQHKQQRILGDGDSDHQRILQLQENDMFS